jgi:hypothetical protein
MAGVLQAQDDEGMSAKPDTARFEITIPARKVANSLYNVLDVVDQRPDTVNLGQITTTTAYDMRVMPLHPLNNELAGLLLQMTDTTAGKEELLLQLRRFTIYDISTPGRKLCVSLRMTFYARGPKGYQELNSLDTILQQPFSSSQSNLRKRVFPAISRILTDAVAKALVQAPAAGAESYSREQVLAIDRIRKGRLALYSVDRLVDGVYIDFPSFLQQKPHYTRFLVTDTSDRQQSDLQMALPGGGTITPGRQQIFAYVENGRAYVSAPDGYHPLTRTGDDFFYTGKIKVAGSNLATIANFGTFAATVASLGRIPLFVIWGQTTKKKFVLKLDYMNGQYEPVRTAD